MTKIESNHKEFSRKSINENFNGFVKGLDRLLSEYFIESTSKDSIYLLIIKILFLKVCEDKELFTFSFKNANFSVKDLFFEKISQNELINNKILEILREKFHPFSSIESCDWKLNYSVDLDNFIYKVLEFLNLFDFKKLDRDILGYFYEKNLSEEKKKSLGQFYTPIEIIDYILDKTGYTNDSQIENFKVIDPSCGSGSFLVRVINRILERYKNKFKTENFSINQAKEILNNIIDNVYGLEINPFACFLTKINYLFQIIEIYHKILQNDPSYELKEFCIFNSDAFEIFFPNQVQNIKLSDLEKLEENRSIREHCEKFTGYNLNFDIVIGNPPYLFIRDLPKFERGRIQSINLATNKGQWDLYQIFIELGLKILNEGGYLGYIVPDSILANPERNIIRKFIYDNSNIKIIHHVGKKFKDLAVSNVIIILQKASKPDYEKNTELIFNSKTNEITNFITQIKIKENWDYKFYLYLSKEEDNLISRLKNFCKFGEIGKTNKNHYLSITRGVELTKKGEVFYCSKCESYFPFPIKYNTCKKCGKEIDPNFVEIIINENKINDFYKPFVTDLKRYKINKYQYLAMNKKGIDYKSLNVYSPNRVIIRQLSENGLICATIEPIGALTSQSVYNIHTNLNVYYLLGIINSKLMSYYFSRIFGGYKGLFQRILIDSIKELPLIIPNDKIEKQIETLIKKIIELNYDKTYNPGKEFLVFEYQSQIDRLVFNLYGLNSAEIKIIRRFFREINRSSKS